MSTASAQAPDEPQRPIAVYLPRSAAMEEEEGSGSLWHAQGVAFIFTVAASLITFLVTHFSAQAREERVSKLQRVDMQLQNLFGPLRMLDIACFQAVTPLAQQTAVEKRRPPHRLCRSWRNGPGRTRAQSWPKTIGIS